MQAGLKKPELLDDPKALLSLLKELKLEQEALHALISTAGVTLAGETVGHPFLPLQEAAADCRSVTLMSAAKLDPQDALKYWKENPSKKTTLMRSHPPAAERSRKLQECIDHLPGNKVADTRLVARKPS